MARRTLVDAIAASLMADQALEEVGIRERTGHVDYETAEFLAANRAAHVAYHRVPVWARWWAEMLADACWRARGSR